MEEKMVSQSSARRSPAELDELLARCGAALCLATMIAGIVWLAL